MQDDVPLMGTSLVEPLSDAVVAPLTVQIEVTWRCNWRCVHCYQDDHSLERLSSETLLALLDDLAALGTLHLVVTGGEPLLRRDLFVLLEAARGRGMAVTLYSNGHRIDRATAARLGGLVAAVEMTLLGGTAAVHDALSGVPGSFAKVLAACDHLRDHGVDVVIKTPLLLPAASTWRTLERLLAERGLPFLPDVEITPTYAGAPAPLAHALDADALARFYRDFPAHDPARARPRDLGAPGGLCRAGRQFAFIDAEGGVYPCLSFKAPLDRAGACLGRITERRFADIWTRAPLFEAIRGLDATAFPTCAACAGAPACSRCLAANFDEHGSLVEPAAAVCQRTATARRVEDPEFVPASRLRQPPVLRARSSRSALAPPEVSMP